GQPSRGTTRLRWRATSSMTANASLMCRSTARAWRLSTALREDACPTDREQALRRAMTSSDPLTHLLSLGVDPRDSVGEPAVAPDTSFLMEAGEERIHSGAHSVVVQVWNEAAGILGTKKQWEPVAMM